MLIGDKNEYQKKKNVHRYLFYYFFFKYKTISYIMSVVQTMLNNNKHKTIYK